jgi:hypothetical protein
MSNKIKELKNQCYLDLRQSDDDEYDMEKFARLIIEEACDVVRDEVQYELDYSKAEILVTTVKKHFGLDVPNETPI